MTSERTAGLPSIDDAAELLERALVHSPADETEIVWLAVRRGCSRHGPSTTETVLHSDRTALIRVLDHGRMGSYRTGESGAGELADAVRQAVAQSRVKEPLAGLPHLPCDESPLAPLPEPCLRDEELARWRAADAERWLASLPSEGMATEMRWAEAAVLVFNSRGLRRTARVTAAELLAQHSGGPGSGRAVAASRTLAGLAPAELIDRARRRHGGDGASPFPLEIPALVLSFEAVATLVDLLNRTALSAAAYADASSLLRRHLGVQVFDRAVEICDDGTDRAGLPFPFDLEGTAKRRMELIAKGTPRTPALDQRQAAQLGLPPTGCSISGNDALAMNLIVAAGGLAEQDLLAAAEGGLWIGWLDDIESTDGHRLGFRALARGLRQVRGGGLATPVPDAVWEDSLLRLLSERPLLGLARGLRLSRDGYLGGVLAPAMTVSPGRLQPLAGPLPQRTKTRV